MKKIFSIFTALLLLFIVGCTKDANLNSGEVPEVEGEKIPVSLTFSAEEGTRTNVNGTIVTWSEYSERIIVLQIVEIEGDKYVLSKNEFESDSDSISPDGKSITFIGEIEINERFKDCPTEYVAIYGSTVDTDDGDLPELDLNYLKAVSLYPEYQGLNPYSEESLNDNRTNLVMVSNTFTIGAEDVASPDSSDFPDAPYSSNAPDSPTFYHKSNMKFNILSSVIALNVYVDNANSALYGVSKLSLLNNSNVFTEFLRLNIIGDEVKLTTGNNKNTYDFNVYSCSDDLSSTTPITFYVPVLYDADLESNADLGEYNISFKTENNFYSETKFIKATKQLQHGYIYSCDVRFDANEFIPGAEGQKEALLDFYDKISGFGLGWTEWNSIENFGGVYTDDYGYVTSIDISSLLTIKKLTDGAIEALAPLTKLNSLSIADCGLEGNLPGAIGSSSIKHIDLSNNDFEGTVPDSYSSFLIDDDKSIKLSGNKLTGAIPTSITENTKMLDKFFRDCFVQRQTFGFDKLEDILIPNTILTDVNNVKKSTSEIFGESEITAICLVSSGWGYLEEVTDVWDMINELNKKYSGLGALSIYYAEYDDVPSHEIGYSYPNSVMNRIPYLDYDQKDYSMALAIVDKNGKVLYSKKLYPYNVYVGPYAYQLQSFVTNYFSQVTE